MPVGEDHYISGCRYAPGAFTFTLESVDGVRRQGGDCSFRIPRFNPTEPIKLIVGQNGWSIYAGVAYAILICLIWPAW
jgi:hypothetical protein